MHTLYLISVWIHILAATVWVGGMLFLVLVVVPWLRKGQGNAALFLRETGERFRNVGWTCFAVLLVTGTFNLWVRGVRFSDFTRWEWLRSPFGSTLILKLCVFLIVLLVSSTHDFVVGPGATRAIAANPGSRETQTARRRASLLGRANVFLALILVGAGVLLVRGLPW